MSKFHIKWEAYDGPETQAWYKRETDFYGSADELKLKLESMTDYHRFCCIEVEIVDDAENPADKMDRFRLEYAHYCEIEFNDELKDGLDIPEEGEGFDVPTYGVMFTTYDEEETERGIECYDLQASYIPDELLFVCWVSGHVVYSEKFEDLDALTNDIMGSEFGDYFEICVQKGREAGIITDEGEF